MLYKEVVKRLLTYFVMMDEGISIIDFFKMFEVTEDKDCTIKLDNQDGTITLKVINKDDTQNA